MENFEMADELHTGALNSPQGPADLDLLDAQVTFLKEADDEKKNDQHRSSSLTSSSDTSSSSTCHRRGYASFLVQHDQTQYESLLHRLPVTDFIDQHGTFHFQLSGSKIWYLQPTITLCQKQK